jgi:hypothetical protein
MRCVKREQGTYPGTWLFGGEHLMPIKIVGGSLVTVGAVILAFA